jgi:hypothetical protein
VFSTPPEKTTAIMTHNAFTSRFDFFTEFTPVHAARKTDDQIDAAFSLFYGAKDVNVTDPMTQALIGLLAQKGLLQPARIPELLAPLPITTRGAIDPETGAITP